MTKKCSIPPDNPTPLTLAQRGNWVDVESLAEMLKSKGLAKEYDGEGARPEW